MTPTSNPIPTSWIGHDYQQAAHELVERQLDSIARQTDRRFVWLMCLQWIAAVAAALWLSPRTWEGTESSVHIHVWAAVILGGALVGFPSYLAAIRPGSAMTRHVFAVAQMLWSALLIDITGGRIETHFHVFGSLAFLAFYRRPSVLLTATVVVTLDHVIRGFWWPQTIYGIVTASAWRTAEHAFWVVFEDAFLWLSTGCSLADMREVAMHQARLEQARGRELKQEIELRTRVEAELHSTHHKLLDAARRAGMAEIATGVLHNVGNVLNSINVSTSIAADRLRAARIDQLVRATGLLRNHLDDLGSFVTSDPKGKQIPGFLAMLSSHLVEERKEILNELENLAAKVNHVKTIVSMQQSYAGVSGVTETFDIAESVDDALKLNSAAFDRHRIEIELDYESLPPVQLDKQKVVQILVNLVKNGQDALIDADGDEPRRLTLRTRRIDDDQFQLEVSDNGVGIQPENLTRIFSHGFTTKKNGHGFGLHSCANAAKELGGSLTARSAGVGQGATFLLRLPLTIDSEIHA